MNSVALDSFVIPSERSERPGISAYHSKTYEAKFAEFLCIQSSYNEVSSCFEVVLKATNIHEFIERIERLKKPISYLGRLQEEDSIAVGKETYPVYSIHLGSQDPNAPAIAFVGGVHGIEMIGAQVLLSYLETLCHLARWDKSTHQQFQGIKVLFYPWVNPGGIALQTRSNPRGVDLMRNAPIEGENISRYFLPGGHRLSPTLPWYRGEQGAEMEQENKTLYRVLKEHIWNSPFSMIVDFHSGFGMKDRLWFPYAYTKNPFPRLAEIFKLKTFFDSAYPYNVHVFEPQSLQYQTHGDFWDYVYLNHQKEKPKHIMIPLCLELGSWIWVKKNPLQIFNSLGLFNPIVPHRFQRTLRRHIYLLDFLLRATYGAQEWSFISDEERLVLEENAKKHWY